MRRTIKALAVAFDALMFWASPAHAVVPNGTYSWWDMPTTNHYNIDGRIFVGRDLAPTMNPAWFASTQFSTANGSPGGYIGIQQDSRKKAIFSWWGAVSSQCSAVPGAVCQRFTGEGEGQQTLIPFNWQVGRTYLVRTWVIGSGPGTTTWGGWIIDESTGVNTHIGNITVPSSFGYLDSAVNWIEWYGGHRSTCAQIPTWSVWFHKLAGHPTSGGYAYAYYPPQNVVRTDGSCPSRLVNWGDPWVLHESPA